MVSNDTNRARSDPWLATMQGIRELQSHKIRQVILLPFAGGGCRIQDWSDHLYELAGFSAADVARHLCISTANARKRILTLVDRHQLPPPFKAATYRLPRSECDQLAEKAHAFWILCGYSATEERQRDVTRESKMGALAQELTVVDAAI